MAVARQLRFLAEIRWLSPQNRENRAGDRFTGDCLHSQRLKSAETFGPLRPWLVMTDEIRNARPA